MLVDALKCHYLQDDYTAIKKEYDLIVMVWYMTFIVIVIKQTYIKPMIYNILKHTEIYQITQLL